jgi:lipopolysaccharide transport system ATP-binding protein
MHPIIEVNHVWKQYHKGIDRRYKSFRDTLSEFPANLLKGKKEKFWALNDIDFSICAGESLGIIGSNGAGKSTLLKILSRITPPTKGDIILHGRVASLLEVGTGFHPELTGRENIYFNGSVLGMKYREIKKRFDEIVHFSGVEDFLDTPLKHYSTGMQMRLAFSVAAHLDAEILLIDEVLAVGDAQFQKKCIGKMDEVSKSQGKSILFVSHNLKAVHDLTENLIILGKGAIMYNGRTDQGLQHYQKNELSFEKTYEKGCPVKKVDIQQSDFLKIRCDYSFDKKPLIPHFGFIISTLEGVNIFGSNPTLAKTQYSGNFKNEGTVEVTITEPALNAGIYNLSIWMGDGHNDIFSDINCIQFEVSAETDSGSTIGIVQPNITFDFV